MPSAADFRRAFRLEQGEHLGPKKEWQISSSHVGHVVKEQNERYEFPTELTLEWRQASRAAGKQLAQRGQQLARAFREGTRDQRIVYSAYGSPYECSYGSPRVAAEDEEGRTFRLTSLGRAVRRRDIATLKDQKAEEREAKGVAEVTKEDERRYLGSYRVIKSRFGTSHCSMCDEVIEPGVKICREKGHEGRGGWVHAACVVQQMREAAGEDGGGEEEKEEGEEAGKQVPAGSRKHGKAARATGKRGRSGTSKRQKTGAVQEQAPKGGRISKQGGRITTRQLRSKTKSEE